MAKILLKLETPLMTGGKRLQENVLESLDYIPGHVMRAAFAKRILMDCPLYDPGQPDSQGRYHYVYIRDENKCDTCPLHQTCETFSKIRFSFFFPQGFEVIPYTARGCKYYDNHGFIDMLLPREALQCRKCVARYGEGRMEAVSGFRSGGKKVSIQKVALTRTAINPYTQTAKDASLYTIYALAPDTVFEGEIEGIEQLNIKEGDIVRVGSYTTVGFGRLRVEKIWADQPAKDMLSLLKEFNRNMGMGKEKNKIYIPVLLTSDAKLEIEKSRWDVPMSDKAYKSRWKQLILGDIDMGLEVEKAVGEHEIYRGYDTSRAWDKWEKEPQVLTLKGTTLLLSTQGTVEHISPELLNRLQDMEKNGIGIDVKNGFGRVEFCSTLHVKGEA